MSVAAARVGPLQRDLHALGTITPLAQVTVRSQVDGELVKLHYREGQTVAQGQLLAEIDPRPYQAALASAEGELAQTQALLDNAEADLRRYRKLARQEAVAGQQLDTAEAQVRAYAAQRQRNLAQVADAQRLLGGTVRLRARFDNADESLFPNQFVNIRLAVVQEDDVVTIPAAAVQYGSQGAFVFVIGDDNRATRRVLTLGPANAGRIVVLTGLAANERVVVEGVDRLHDGSDVQIVDPPGHDEESA
ncbi:biotin/lipoyl-binding protein [Achromobacter mucicolens]|uniref:biotin/lipoyl-binding protein n=1 Tax=Achromobacter mucicolens TaxID=1389922 RepID=UPI002FE4243C